MNRFKRFSTLIVTMLAMTGCSIFEDPTPETISIRMGGSADGQVRAIFAQVFVAGINQETNTTQVRVTSSDTVIRTLPLDTVIDIADSRQLFMQVESVAMDTLDVGVRIDIDTRNVLQRQGLIFPEQPFRYVYQFNRPLTNVVEVIF